MPRWKRRCARRRTSGPCSPSRQRCAGGGLHGLIPAEAAETIATVCVQFQPDVAALARGVASDGVVVPALVRALRAAAGPEVAPHVHRGATSQDVIDTSLMLRLKPLAARFCTRLGAILARLAALDAAFGERP